MKPVLLAALGSVALLAGCATPTPYQPLGAPTGVRGGFSEQQIERNRFRVSFSGNQFTSRDRVENYLLFRAADLTAQQGYDGFTVVDRETDRRTSVQTTPRPFGAGPWGYWGPSWRYGGRFGWRSWDPWGYDPFWADTIDVRTIVARLNGRSRANARRSGHMRASVSRAVMSAFAAWRLPMTRSPTALA